MKNPALPWLRGLHPYFPKLRRGELAALLGRLERVPEPGVWRGAVRGRGGEHFGLSFSGSGDFHRWKRQIAKILPFGPDAEALRPPEAGLPWLSLSWDAAQGKPVGAALLGREESGRHRGVSLRWPGRARAAFSARAVKFAPEIFGEPSLEKAFADFHALCPAKDVVFEEQEGMQRWSLRLREPVAWPLFQKLDIAAPFAPQSTWLSFILLNARVSSLSFDGEDLWVCFDESVMP